MSLTDPPADSHGLARALRDFTRDALVALRDAHLPGWRLPRTFAGHAVAADVRADLVFTLGLLADAGVDDVGGDAPDAVIRDLLAGVHGAATHSFFSYRIAETLLRHGPFADNPLLAGLPDAQLDEVRRAVDSSDWVAALDAHLLPRNYAAVLARCELARERLGLLTDRSGLDDLLARAATMLDESPGRFLDDSNERLGRYDIYSADVWLFCEPLAADLGPRWVDGACAALALVERVGTRDGTAVPWGRSTGVLGAALTVELAALALEHDLAASPEGWVRRGAIGARAVMQRFDADGVCDAHRHRAQDRYRGPARRLQLTLDVLGKLAYAAGAIARVAPVATASRAEAFPSRTEVVAFEADRPAAVWVHRSPGTEVVVPFVGSTRSHYLPAPHAPGTFEVPVDEDLPCWTPLVVDFVHRHTAGGVPDALRHDDGALHVRWDRLERSGVGLEDEGGPALTATREATFRVDGRTLELTDTLTFPKVPDAVSLLVPETATRPLHVEVECETAHATSRITVDGLAEWRSPFSELAAVHQLDLDPAPTLRYRVRATPALRVASTAFGHHYDASLYGPLRGRVVELPPPVGWQAGPDATFDDVDLFHLHWPEWVAFDDLAAHTAIIDRLRDHGIPVVWTAHNLTPHDRRPDVYDPIYAMWARAADGVIHHSAWGQARMLDRYDFAPGCRHVVIPHGHFGDLWAATEGMSREDAARALGLPPAAIRIGLVGAPRADKAVRAFLDGVVASDRDDIQVVCWSLGVGEDAPDDPRIAIAEPYQSVDPGLYGLRLATCDALALPFVVDGDMLGTGTSADAIGRGLPVLASDWGYLTETLGDAAIPCGHTAASVAACLDALTAERLATAAAASRALREATAWPVLADQTLALFERVVQGRP